MTMTSTASGISGCRACSGCGSQAETLRHALEPRLRERLAWIERVEQG